MHFILFLYAMWMIRRVQQKTCYFFLSIIHPQINHAADWRTGVEKHRKSKKETDTWVYTVMFQRNSIGQSSKLSSERGNLKGCVLTRFVVAKHALLF